MSNINYSRICNTVKQYCLLNNIDFKKIQERLELPMSTIYKARKNGISFNQLGNEYRCTSKLIKDKLVNYCNNNNLEIPDIENINYLSLEEIYIKRTNGVSYKNLVDEYGFSKIKIQNDLKEYCKNNDLEYPIFSDIKEEITPEEAYNEKKLGKSYIAIAEEYGYDPYIIRKYIIDYCHNNNLEIPKYKKIVSLPIEEIYKKRKKGLSYKALAKEYGHSHEYIRQKLIKFCEEKNIDISVLNSTLITKQIFIDRKNGLNYDELTRKYDCSVAEINDNIINSCSNEIIRLNNILKKEYQIKLLLDLKAILLKAQNNISKDEDSITIGKTLSLKNDKIKRI